jgi:hypothetical protein
MVKAVGGVLFSVARTYTVIPRTHINLQDAPYVFCEKIFFRYLDIANNVERVTFQ